MKKEKTEIAIFAGGCFWCMVPPFEKLSGVLSVIAGYTGGKSKNIDYSSVSTGKTGHYEAVQVTFNPDKIKYEKLLETFWHQINPEDSGGQFADRGTQYMTAIFYINEKQKRLALTSKAKLLKTGNFGKIATKILPASDFYAAEEYHQDYYKKHPLQYKLYKKMSGREDFIKNTWEKK